MRLTKDELLKKYSWYGERNIVAVKYGDEPLYRVNNDTCRIDHEKSSSDTIDNIEFLKHWLCAVGGNYAHYDTFIGGVDIFPQYYIGCADLISKYNGHTYNINLVDLYGKPQISITLITSTVFREWCCNQPDKSWISRHYETMSKEEALKILEEKRFADYGEPIKRTIKKIREIVERN
jgi:hypothetical protein